MKKKVSFLDSLTEPTPKQVQKIQKLVLFIGSVSTAISVYPELHTPKLISTVMGLGTVILGIYLQTFTINSEKNEA